MNPYIEKKLMPLNWNCNGKKENRGDIKRAKITRKDETEMEENIKKS